MSSVRVVYLPKRPASWDSEIEEVAESAVFHQSPWLDFIQACNKGSEIDYFRILQGKSQIGNFCALKLRRGPFSVYSDPKFGYAADQQPLVAGDVDKKELLEALLKAASERSVDHILLRGRWLDDAPLPELGFTKSDNVTHVCDLHSDEEQTWDALKGIARTRIRKAMKQGVTAECTLDDPSIADHFCHAYTEVLKRKGLKPQYGVEVVRSLVSILGSRDSLFAIWAKHQDSVIGAAFYVYDNNAMYFLDGASNLDCLDLCPNDILHWTAIRMAVARGIPRFFIGGGPVPSRFTRKFTGYLLPQNTYNLNLNPLFEVTKGVYSVVKTVTELIKKNNPV